MSYPILPRRPMQKLSHYSVGSSNCPVLAPWPILPRSTPKLAAETEIGTLPSGCAATACAQTSTSNSSSKQYVWHWLDSSPLKRIDRTEWEGEILSLCSRRDVTPKIPSPFPTKQFASLVAVDRARWWDTREQTCQHFRWNSRLVESWWENLKK